MIKDYDFRDFAGAAARAFNTLRLEPDKGLNQALQTIQQQRTANRAKNKTVEYLKGLGTPTGDRLAAMVGTGQLKGSQAYGMMFDMEKEARAAARATSAADLAFDRRVQLAEAGNEFTAGQNLLGREATAEQSRASQEFQLEKMRQENELLINRQNLNRSADFQNRKELMELQNSLGVDRDKIKSLLSLEQATFLANYNFDFKKKLLGLTNQYGMERDAAKAALTPSAKEAEISRIMKSFNLPRADAIGIVDGVIKIIPNEVTGIAQKYNIATNERTEFKPDNITDLKENLGIKSNETGDTSNATGSFAGKDTRSALGLTGLGANFVNTITDAISGRFAFPESGEAKAALDSLEANTILSATVDVAGKPSNFTRQTVQDKMAIAGGKAGMGAAKAIARSKIMVNTLKETADYYESIVKGDIKVDPTSVSLATEELPKIKRFLADYTSLLESLQNKSTIQSKTNLPAQDQALINKYRNDPLVPQLTPPAD
jgi:hypothetical protein